MVDFLDTEIRIGYNDGGREFQVSMDTSGTFHFLWTNGDPMTVTEINSYCIEINGAKAIVENRVRDAQQGHGLPLYNPTIFGGTPSKGGYFYPADRPGPHSIYTYPGQVSKTTDPGAPCRVDKNSTNPKPIHVI